MNPDSEWLDHEVNGRSITTNSTKPFQTFEVCWDCNHRWMAPMESGVAPLLKRMFLMQVTDVEPTELQRLANWAYKTALMVESGWDGDVRGFHVEEYRRFRESGLPPVNCSIVMGWAGRAITAYHRSIPQPGGPWTWLPGWSALLITANVYFHFIGDSPKRGAHWHLLQAEMGERLIPLWPPIDASNYPQVAPLGPQSWPPQLVTSKEMLEELAGLFGTEPDRAFNLD